MRSGAGQRPSRVFAGPLAFYSLLLLLALLGVAVRWRAAQGELWLDEIWSLTLIAPLRNAGQVFWGISHDNNHFLNSLWLFAMGPTASTLSLRALSIAMGGAAVLAAGWAGYRTSWFSGLTAALLCALGLVFVDHGSEARGYGGLIACGFVACGAWLRAHADAASGQRWLWLWVMACAIGLAALFHLTGAALAAVLGLAHLAVLRERAGDTGVAIGRSLRDFWPVALALTPAMASLAAGIVVTGKLAVGGISPFSWGHFLNGFAGVLAGLAGHMPAAPTGSGLLAGLAILGVAAVLLLACVAKRLLSRAMIALAVAGLIIMPLAMALVRLPNLEFARYFLVPAVVAVLVLAQGAGALWERGGLWCGVGAAIPLLFGLANAAALPGYHATGRGERMPVLQAIARSGEPVYGSNSNLRVPMIAQFLARRSGLSINHVSEAGLCESPPRWFIGEVADPALAPPQIKAGPKACSQAYRRSGLVSKGRADTWVLYQRL